MKQRSRRDRRTLQADSAAPSVNELPRDAALERQSLLHALRRAHVRLGLTAIIAAAAMLTLLSVLTLHTHVERNLALIARSIAYASEAAVMFDDSEAAREAVKAIADAEGLLAASITRPDGSRLATYQREPNRGVAETLSEFGSLIFQLQAKTPVLHRGLEIGRVQVRGDGGVYLL
ncbi:MAG TPA: CHASE sensor domain-containing protein [Burkholderiaceae bacterium]|nr:CHASE sensor domain-containing protein [Burkholderiaceae bacterium]